ncbi:MAG: tetratricopeptide repeat protein [bacterium]
MSSNNSWWWIVGLVLSLILIGGFWGCRGCGPQEETGVKPESRKAPLTKDDYIKKAELYYLAGDYEEAVSVLEEAVKLDPKDAYLHLELGRVYEDMGKDTESINAYIQAIKLDPSLKNISVPEVENEELWMEKE